MSGQDFKSDTETENPTVITDRSLIQQEEHARLMNRMSLFRLMLLLCIQNQGARSAQLVSGRQLTEQLDEIYEQERIYAKRVYENLDWLREKGLVERRDSEDHQHDYRLTPKAKGFVKRHAELVVGLANGQEYLDIVR